MDKMYQAAQFLIVQILLISIGTTPSLAISTNGDTKSTIQNSNETRQRNQTEAVCTDFLEILVDHIIGRATRHIQDPVSIGDMHQTFFSLSNGRLYGLSTLQRTCPLKLEHEEVWHRSKLIHPNMDIQLEEWRRKQDTKVADILHLRLCLGIPKSLQLRGNLTVSSLWETYPPELVRITLSDISIRVRVTLHLNRTGKMEVKLGTVFVERLNRISFEEDKPALEKSNSLDMDSLDTEPSSGLINRIGSLLDWLANGPLYTPLLIVLEGSLRDSFQSMLKEKTQHW